MAKQRDIIDDIWDRIEVEIYNQNRTKKEVAEKCGFDRKNLFGRRDMRLMNFARLCQELNVSADWLLFGDDWEAE